MQVLQNRGQNNHAGFPESNREEERNMKKLVWVALVLALCISLTGCDRMKNIDSASDSGSLSEDFSNGMSDLSDQISEGVSDLSDDLSDDANDFSDQVSDLDPSNNDNDSASESQPASTRPAEINAAALEKLDNTKQGWGQGTQVDDRNRPVGALQFQEKYGKYDAYFIHPTAEKLYLTFDEGYENGYTASILDTLKAKKVSAVFFVTYDYCKRNPELVKRMIAEGHAVGNHSWSHPSMPTVSISEGAGEITKLHDYVQENFGYTMTLFRPPMGEFSERTLALAKQLGYKSVFWSFAYKDWDPDNQIGADAACRKVTSATHPGEILLLHAVSKDNAAILGTVIDRLRSDGYTFGLL